MFVFSTANGLAPSYVCDTLSSTQESFGRHTGTNSAVIAPKLRDLCFPTDLPSFKDNLKT